MNNNNNNDRDKIPVQVPGLTLVFGGQGYGKTSAIKAILYENRQRYSFGIIFTHTGFSDDGFRKFIKDRRFIHPRYNPDVIERVKQIQKKRIIANRKRAKPCYIVFDDCLEKEAWRDESFTNLLYQLRHYRVHCIISTQYPASIPSNLRSNAFSTLIFKPNGYRAFRAIYESYGGDFKNETEFKEFIIAHIPAKYKFLLYNANAGVDIQDKFTLFTTPNHVPALA